MLAPTLRAEPVDESRRAIIGVLIAIVVLLSVGISVLAVELHHASTLASAQPCVISPGMAPDEPAGAGEAHLPSAASLAPTPDSSNVPVEPNGNRTARNAGTDVVDYLKFVQSIDEKRVALENVAKPASPPPGAQSENDPNNGSPTITETPVQTPNNQAAPASDTVAQWQQLIASFQATTPPDSCALLAATYLNFLKDSLTAASQTSQSSTAAAALPTDAGKAETELARVCANTHAQKTFSIVFPLPATVMP